MPFQKTSIGNIYNSPLNLLPANIPPIILDKKYLILVLGTASVNRRARTLYSAWNSAHEIHRTAGHWRSWVLFPTCPQGSSPSLLPSQVPSHETRESFHSQEIKKSLGIHKNRHYRKRANAYTITVVIHMSRISRNYFLLVHSRFPLLFVFRESSSVFPRACHWSKHFVVGENPFFPWKAALCSKTS